MCEYEQENHIINESFDIYDEVHECVEPIHSLEESLSASWDVMFMEAKRYYEENGNLIIPQSYINESNYRIWQWLTVQRTNYRKNVLSEDRIKRLESIGMCWLTMEERVWNESYEMCKDYYESHKTLEGIPQFFAKAVN